MTISQKDSLDSQDMMSLLWRIYNLELAMLELRYQVPLSATPHVNTFVHCIEQIKAYTLSLPAINQEIEVSKVDASLKQVEQQVSTLITSLSLLQERQSSTQDTAHAQNEANNDYLASKVKQWADAARVSLGGPKDEESFLSFTPKGLFHRFLFVEDPEPVKPFSFYSPLDVTPNDLDGPIAKYGSTRAYYKESLYPERAFNKHTFNAFVKERLDKEYKHIANLIEKNFKGHDFEVFIASLLQAQGFQVQVSPYGPDGGVDILASNHSLGLGGVKLCVQVKSSVNPIDRKVLDQLSGVMHKFNADYGLLVSWGGFKANLSADEDLMFFQIRMWSKVDVVKNFLLYYPKLDDSLKKQIPLRQVWKLAK